MKSEQSLLKINSNVISLKNPYFGRENFSSKSDADFNYKNASEYDLQEWMDNIFIYPCENSNFLNSFSFMDKRSTVTYSLMGVSMIRAEIDALRDDSEACRRLMMNYFNQPYFNATLS